MPVYTILPTSYSYSGNWQSTYDAGNGITYQQNVSYDFDYLAIEFTPAVPAGWQIVGLVMRFNLQTAEPGHASIGPTGYVSIEAGISISGSGAITGPNLRSTGYNQDALGNRAIAEQLGSPTDLWGQVVTPAYLNSAGFAIYARRGTEAGEDTINDRFLSSIELDIYYNASSDGSHMGIQPTVHQSSWFGKETTPGTAVPTPNLLKAVEVQLDPKMTIKEQRTMGDKLPRRHSLFQDETSIKIDGYPTYNEMGWLLSTLIAKPNSQAVPGSATAYQHTFNLNSRDIDLINTLTMVCGSENGARQSAFCFLDGLTLKIDPTDATLTGSGFGQKTDTTVSQPTGVNEVQTITFGGSPTGGTFTLAFRNLSTGPITWSAVAATLATNIQTALLALADVGASGVAVSGTGPFTVTFGGALAGIKLELLVANASGLTGTAPTVAVAEVTPGGYTEIHDQPILTGGVTYYIATTYAGIPSGALLNVHKFEMQIAGKAKTVYFQNAANLNTFSANVEDKAKITAKITGMATSESMAMYANVRSESRLFFRLIAQSPSGVTIDGTNPYQLQIDMASDVEAIGPLSDSDGIYALEYTLSALYDQTNAYSFILTLTNDIPSY